jgi:hypothetical protein
VAGTTISPFGNPERPRRPGFGSASPVPDAPHISSSFYRRSRLVATGAAAAGTHAVRKKGEKRGNARRHRHRPLVHEGTKSTPFLFFFLAPDAARSRRAAGKGGARLQCPDQCTRDRAGKGARACNARASAQETGRRLSAAPAPTSRVYGGGGIGRGRGSGPAGARPRKGRTGRECVRMFFARARLWFARAPAVGRAANHITHGRARVIGFLPSTFAKKKGFLPSFQAIVRPFTTSLPLARVLLESCRALSQRERA